MLEIDKSDLDNIDKSLEKYKHIMNSKEFEDIVSYLGKERFNSLFSQKHLAAIVCLLDLPEEERMDIFSIFCGGCGTVTVREKCHCWNDE